MSDVPGRNDAWLEAFENHEDSLRPVKGILLGIALGIVMWGLVGVAVWVATS